MLHRVHKAAHKMRLAFRVTVDEKCRHGAKPCRIGDRLTLILGAQLHADGNMTILSVSRVWLDAGWQFGIRLVSVLFRFGYWELVGLVLRG